MTKLDIGSAGRPKVDCLTNAVLAKDMDGVERRYLDNVPIILEKGDDGYHSPSIQ